MKRAAKELADGLITGAEYDSIMTHLRAAKETIDRIEDRAKREAGKREANAV